jgi:hypothetical protein
MPYEIEEHKHRFSAWAAGRAASVNGCRFKVERAQEIIEAVGLRQYIENSDTLPDALTVDRQHESWREAVIVAAGQRNLIFTHGIAAKLINIYLKAGVVCGGHHDHANISYQHPPIDKVLLNELGNLNIGGFRREWRADSASGWSNFNSAQYQAVITRIRVAIPNTPLWKVEQYWQGHQ